MGILPFKKENKHINCWDIDQNYCIRCQETFEEHPQFTIGYNEAIDQCQAEVDNAVDKIELIRQSYCSCEEGRQCLTCKAMEEVKEFFK